MNDCNDDTLVSHERLYFYYIYGSVCFGSSKTFLEKKMDVNDGLATGCNTAEMSITLVVQPETEKQMIFRLLMLAMIRQVIKNDMELAVLIRDTLKQAPLLIRVQEAFREGLTVEIIETIFPGCDPREAHFDVRSVLLGVDNALDLLHVDGINSIH